MKLFIFNYASPEDIDCLRDDMRHVDLDQMASPQFHSIATEETFDVKLAELKKEIEDQAREFEDIEQDDVAVWYTYPRREGDSVFRGSQMFDLVTDDVLQLGEWNDETPIARIIVQIEEIS